MRTAAWFTASVLYSRTAMRHYPALMEEAIAGSVRYGTVRMSDRTSNPTRNTS